MTKVVVHTHPFQHFSAFAQSFPWEWVRPGSYQKNSLVPGFDFLPTKCDGGGRRYRSRV